VAHYIELGNRLIGHGPYLHEDVALHGFTLQGDRQKIQDLLDKMFSSPSGGKVRYTAISGKVLVSIAYIDKVGSMVEKNHGTISEIDVTFWVLALAHEFSLDVLRWIPVYLFVDSAAAMAAGREVYGFPKQLGQFEIATKAPTIQRYSTTAFVIEKFEAGARGAWKPLLEVEPLEAKEEEDDDSVWDDLKNAEQRFFERLLPDVEFKNLINFQFDAIKPRITMAFLKQFPSIVDTRAACYQVIAESIATVEKFRGSGLTRKKFRAKVYSYDSHPLHDELGLAPGWQDIGRAVWVDYDFLAHLGRVKWGA
jgi:hypothetical protein